MERVSIGPPTGYATHLPLGDTFTKTINGKSINWTPSEILCISLRGINIIGPTFGYATHLLSRDKTFLRFQKGLSSRHILKVQYTFTKTINGKSSIGPLLDMLRIFLRGIKNKYNSIYFCLKANFQYKYFCFKPNFQENVLWKVGLSFGKEIHHRT